MMFLTQNIASSIVDCSTVKSTTEEHLGTYVFIHSINIADHFKYFTKLLFELLFIGAGPL